MTGTFACPECGDEVRLQGATPGRHVQCERCETWVEVPFLPRDGVWTRPRFGGKRPRWMIPAAWAGVVLFGVVVAVVAWAKVSESRAKAGRDATLDAILRAADEADRRGKPGRALSEVEAALAFLRENAPGESARIGELRSRRDGLSIREAEARLAGSAGLEPSQAVGEILTLQARARTDRALDPLIPAILRALEEARRRQVAADLAEARRAGDDRRPFDVLAMAERAMTVAEKLGADEIRAATVEAEALTAPVLRRIGAIVVQERGRYTLGTPELFDATLAPRIADALRKLGYAPKPSRGPIRDFWDRQAPVRLNFQIEESQNATYLQSPSKLSEITAILTMTRGSEMPWRDRVTARSEVPLPGLPAYLGGRLAVSGRREPETERRLYENARSGLLDQLATRLRGIPPP